MLSWSEDKRMQFKEEFLKAFERNSYAAIKVIEGYVNEDIPEDILAWSFYVLDTKGFYEPNTFCNLLTRV